MKNVFILAAENSAEKYGAQVVATFQKQKAPVKFFGVGGKQLRNVSVDIILDNREFAVVGIVEVLSSIFKLKRYMNLILREIIKRNTAAVLLIDYPDFNLRLAKKIKKLGIPVFYYISPTVWAWRYSRVNHIRKYVDHIFIIFPFEIDIFKLEKIPFTYTGHPLLRSVKATTSKIEFRSKFSVSQSERVITLLPGSRRSEVQFLLPEMLKAVDRLQSQYQAKFFLLKADNIESGLITSYLNGRDLTVLNQADGYNLINASDIIITTCGTSNLEIALLGVPFVAVYQVNRLSYLLGKRFVKINRYSIVNILAGQEVITELIQKNFNANNIVVEVQRILNQPEVRNKMCREFENIQTSLAQDLNPGEIIYGKMADVL